MAPIPARAFASLSAVWPGVKVKISSLGTRVLMRSVVAQKDLFTFSVSSSPPLPPTAMSWQRFSEPWISVFPFPALWLWANCLTLHPQFLQNDLTPETLLRRFYGANICTNDCQEF